MPRPKTGWHWAAVALVATAACPDPPPPPSPVKAVEMIPGAVTVGPLPVNSATSFTLQARLRDASGAQMPLPGSSTIAWLGGPSSVTWVTVGPSTTIEAAAAVAANPGQPSWDYKAAAIVDFHLATPTDITGIVNPATWAGDRITGRHTAGATPSVAMVSGAVPGPDGVECRVYATTAFVTTALLADHGGACPAPDRYAVFSPDRAFTVANHGWTAGAEAIDVTSAQTTPLALPIAVRVVIDDPSLGSAELDNLRDAVRKQAVADIARARAILATMRTGITLALVDDDAGEPPIVTNPSDIAAVDGTCSGADALASGASAVFSAATLNVYYVGSLGPGDRGFACLRHDGRAEPVVYVSWEKHSETTLVHELGHALGLIMPWWGHAAATSGFEKNNVMSHVDDASVNDRNHLALGQAFRMNVEQESWLNHARNGPSPVRPAGALRLPCQCEPHTTTPCPMLAADIVPVPGAGAPVPPEACADEIWLNQTTAEHQGTGLWFGRRWRDAPGVCSGGPVSGTRRVAFHLFLQIPNVTRPTWCKFWVAALFEDHAVFYREIADDPATWNDGFNAGVLMGVPADPFTIAMNVWSLSGFETMAQGDADLAVARYDAAPTGILLNATAPVTVPTIAPGVGPCALTPAASDINVYYVPAAHPLAPAAGDGKQCEAAGRIFIVIHTGVRHTNTALAHHIGAALGLAPVTTADGLDASNLMFAATTLAEAATRRGLTLGQIFRLHVDFDAWLNRIGGRTEATLRCGGADGAACPPVSIGP